jgi:hypothetical protein
MGMWPFFCLFSYADISLQVKGQFRKVCRDLKQRPFHVHLNSWPVHSEIQRISYGQPRSLRGLNGASDNEDEEGDDLTNASSGRPQSLDYSHSSSSDSSSDESSPDVPDPNVVVAGCQSPDNSYSSSSDSSDEDEEGRRAAAICSRRRRVCGILIF